MTDSTQWFCSPSKTEDGSLQIICGYLQEFDPILPQTAWFPILGSVCLLSLIIIGCLYLSIRRHVERKEIRLDQHATDS